MAFIQILWPELSSRLRHAGSLIRRNMFLVITALLRNLSHNRVYSGFLFFNKTRLICLNLDCPFLRNVMTKPDNCMSLDIQLAMKAFYTYPTRPTTRTACTQAVSILIHQPSPQSSPAVWRDVTLRAFVGRTRLGCLAINGKSKLTGRGQLPNFSPKKRQPHVFSTIYNAPRIFGRDVLIKWVVSQELLQNLRVQKHIYRNGNLQKSSPFL